MTGKKLHQLLMPYGVYCDLKKIGQASGKSVAAIIREAITLYLTAFKSQKQATAGE